MPALQPDTEPETGESIMMKLPDGFRLTEHGLVWQGPNEAINFYPDELYVTALTPDDVAVIATESKEFRIPAALLENGHLFFAVLAANGVSVVGLERKRAMYQYIKKSIDNLERTVTCPHCNQKFMKGGN